MDNFQYVISKIRRYSKTDNTTRNQINKLIIDLLDCDSSIKQKEIITRAFDAYMSYINIYSRDYLSAIIDLKILYSEELTI